MHQQTDPAVLRQRAESGDQAAQLAIGKLELARAEYDDAASWLRRAADQGNPEAMCLYGSMYTQGLGVDQDLEAGAYWLRQSADAGFVEAQRLMGDSFSSGQGVPVNHQFAAQWYRRAADNGDKIAALRYGMLLRRGDGVEKDLAEAARWLEKAADAGEVEAMTELCLCIRDMDNFDGEAFVRWAQRATAVGDAHGTFLLGWAWETLRDIQEIHGAVDLYRRAAELGWVDAQLRLGKLYAEGKIVPANQQEAERWLSMAVESGNVAKAADVEAASQSIAAVGAVATITEYPPGAIIENKYFIMSLVGRGGMCMVYKAKHLLMNKTVALKMLLPDSAPDASQTERFRREAQAAASLNHPNIIAVHDIGVSPDGKSFMVLEFIEGHSLEKRLETSGPLTNLKALSIFMQVASALQAAHDAGIIHRDIKPSNIMLCETKSQSDAVKVVDFGLAKMMDETNEMKLTKSGEVFGTLLYMSPEQCLGHPLDQRTDIYSLGCTMYEALTGSPAWRGNTPYEVMSKHINEVAPPMPPELGVPPLLEKLILKSLSKDRAMRQQNMQELQSELQEALGSVLGPD